MYKQFILKKCIILSGLLLSLSVFSQPSKLVKTDIHYLIEKGEVYLSFELPSPDIFQQLIHSISLDKIEDGVVFVYVNEEGLEQLKSAGINYQVQVHPGEVDFHLNMKDWVDLQAKDLSETWDFYPSWDAYVNLMYRFENDFPDLCRIYNIGKSVMGRDILFARISAPNFQGVPRPRFQYTSTMHGDETAGFVISLRLIHHLISQYGIEEMVTQLLDNVEIWISPNTNPDGTYTGDNSTIFGATRFNANNIDLNRNYPNPVQSPQGPIQPETLAMINLADTLHFVMSANIHGGEECVNYPFDSWRSYLPVNRHADHLWWQFVSHEYADTARHYSPVVYFSGFDRGVTHGGDWYVVYGSRQDYMNYYASTREFTLELSQQKMLDPALLPAHWEYNYRSLINYINQSRFGIRGIVTDPVGRPLAATVEIIGHDQNNSQVNSNGGDGSFFRPLLAGTYDISFSAQGYDEQVFENVVIENYSYVTLDVQMGPAQGPLAVFVPEVLEFPLTVVGRQAEAWLEIRNEGDDTLQIFLDDISGDQVFGYHVPAKLSMNIQPGSTRSILFWFAPNQTGRYAATANFRTNDALQPQVSITLVAEAMPEGPIIQAVESSLDFGNVYPGFSISKTLTLKNSGNKELLIQAMNLSIDAFKVDEIYPISLQADDFFEVSVEFLPVQVQDYDAVLEFVSNALNNDDILITLKGRGDPVLATEPIKNPSGLGLYPNPVTKGSILRFTSLKSGRVEALLYDSRGSLLHILFSGQKEPGTHLLEAGSYFPGLPPGLYFIRLLHPQGATTLKVVKTW